MKIQKSGFNDKDALAKFRQEIFDEEISILKEHVFGDSAVFYLFRKRYTCFVFINLATNKTEVYTNSIYSAIEFEDLIKVSDSGNLI